MVFKMSNLSLSGSSPKVIMGFYCLTPWLIAILGLSILKVLIKLHEAARKYHPVL